MTLLLLYVDVVCIQLRFSAARAALYTHAHGTGTGLPFIEAGWWGGYIVIFLYKLYLDLFSVTVCPETRRL